MVTKFSLKGIKPISYNKYLYGRTHTRTTAARKWGSSVAKIVNGSKDIQKKINALRAVFDATRHCLKVTFIFHTPKEYFITSTGEISLRSQDIDNCLKGLIDTLFCSRYRDRGEIKNFAIDDKSITCIYAEKICSLDDTYKIDIQVELLDIPFNIK